MTRENHDIVALDTVKEQSKGPGMGLSKFMDSGRGERTAGGQYEELGVGRGTQRGEGEWRADNKARNMASIGCRILMPGIPTPAGIRQAYRLHKQSQKRVE